MELKEAFLMVACQLAFECQKCGHCCTSMDGYGITEEESQKLCTMGYSDLVENGRIKITERGRCPFYVENTCQIYEDRPDVCRKYPHLNYDPALGGFTLHFYKTCPGSMKLLEEISTCKRNEEFTEDYIDELLELALMYAISDVDSSFEEFRIYLETNNLMDRQVFNKWLSQNGFHSYLKKYIAKNIRLDTE